jgi:hypothetical protein
VNTNELGRWKCAPVPSVNSEQGNTPRESALYLAGASPEEMMENKYVRSIGFVPYDWLGYGANVNSFQHGGGLGLRGYAGYLAPDLDADGNLIVTYRGNTGISASGELDLDGLVRFRPGKWRSYLHLDVYLFGDVGMMGYRTISANGEQLHFAEPRADAGIGAAVTIKKWGPLVDHQARSPSASICRCFLSALPATETRTTWRSAMSSPSAELLIHALPSVFSLCFAFGSSAGHHRPLDHSER